MNNSNAKHYQAQTPSKPNCSKDPVIVYSALEDPFVRKCRLQLIIHIRIISHYLNLDIDLCILVGFYFLVQLNFTHSYPLSEC